MPGITWSQASIDGKTMCQRNATTDESDKCKGGVAVHAAWYTERKYQVAAVLIFAVGLLGAGLAVASNSRKGATPNYY